MARWTAMAVGYPQDGETVRANHVYVRPPGNILHGETSYPIADALADQRVPLLFITGYSRDILPARFASRPLLRKPVLLSELNAALNGLLQ